MITSAVDILYIALAVAAIVLTVFIAITLAYLIFILRDASKVISEVEEVVDRVNRIIITPFKFLETIGSYIGPFIEKIAKKRK